MSHQDPSDQSVQSAPMRRPARPVNKAAIASMIEFFDGEEGRVWQIQRTDGTIEVQVEADMVERR